MADSVFSDPFSHSLLSPVLLSCHIQQSLNAAAATVVAAVAVSTAAAVAVSTVEVGAFMVAVEAFMVAVEASMVAVVFTVAGGRLVEEVTAKAAAFVVDQKLVFMGRAAVLTAGLNWAAVLDRAEIELRIFVRQSTMGSGIRSAARVVPRV